jgi:hypothetical protein
MSPHRRGLSVGTSRESPSPISLRVEMAIDSHLLEQESTSTPAHLLAAHRQEGSDDSTRTVAARQGDECQDDSVTPKGSRLLSTPDQQPSISLNTTPRPRPIRDIFSTPIDVDAGLPFASGTIPRELNRRRHERPSVFRLSSVAGTNENVELEPEDATTRIRSEVDPGIDQNQWQTYLVRRVPRNSSLKRRR